jgi:hypothetical protein
MYNVPQWFYRLFSSLTSLPVHPLAVFAYLCGMVLRMPYILLKQEIDCQKAVPVMPPLPAKIFGL